jgi:hypothetical protein
MSFMSFLDNVNDKASRIIPSAFTDVVAETTDETLLTINMPTLMFICDSVNSNAENIPDLIRALRRRIDNKVPKVQYFTIQTLDAVVKNCGLMVHLEIASTKGLLRDLIEIACRVPSRDGEAEAKEVALTLILNLSLWFSGHPDERLKILTTLADWTRKQAGPNCFEGIEPDMTVTIRRVVNRPGSTGQRHRREGAAPSNYQRRQQMEYLRLQQMHDIQQSAQPRVVQAIPFLVPTEEEVSGMLDACILLAECLNTAEQNHEAVMGNELIAGIAAQVRRQHRDLSRILSAGEDLDNFDVLFSVTDTQTSVIQRLADVIRGERGVNNNNNLSPQTSTYLGDGVVEPRPSSELLREASDTPASSAPAPTTAPKQTSTTTTTTATGATTLTTTTSGARRAYHVRQADDIDAIEMTESAAPVPKPVPTMESLFDAATPAPTAAAAPAPAKPSAGSHSGAAFPAPSQSMDHTTPAQQGMSHSDNPTSLNADTDDFDAFLSSRLK